MKHREDSEFDGLLWHYTDTPGLIGIVSNHRLWAGSAAFMNDTNEMITHELALRNAYQRIRDEFDSETQVLLDNYYAPEAEMRKVHDRFLISASENGDLLTLWRNYGGNGGAFAVGLTPDVCLKPVLQHPEEMSHPAPLFGYYEDAEDVVDGEPIRLYDPDLPRSLGGEWKRVKYVTREGSELHEQQIREQGNYLLDKQQHPEKYRRMIQLADVFPDAPPSLEKDEAFQDEREVRIIVTADPDWKFVKYRNGDFGLTPYVELGTKTETTDFDSEASPGTERLPIAKIMIGPSRHDAQRQRASLRALLDAHGYGEVEIELSAIPYR